MTWNPFDWTAEPFLALYTTLAAVVLLWAFYLRSTIGPASQATRELNALELAYLAGGAHRLGDAVLLSLTSENGATIDAKGHTIAVSDQKPLAGLLNRPPLLSFRSSMTRQQFQTAVQPIVRRVRERLQAIGYAPSSEQMTAYRVNILPFIGLLLAFGITKAVVGAGRHHPVGLLVFLIVVTAIVGVILATTPQRTLAGNDVLRTYQATHARASRAPRDHELLLAVALSGPIVLSGTAYASVYAASRTMNSSGGDGGGSGCGGGGGGGGGGCGGCS